MKFGLISINTGFRTGEGVIKFAQHAEAVGIESIWTFEHTIIPLEYESKYPYSEDGKMGGTPDINIVDPLISLAAAAAATKTIRLGTGVNVLPQVNPVYLAKQAASIDFMSNGRLMLGLGLGWLKEEFEVLGVPWARRGARFDDYVVAMRKMWAGDVVEHQSDFISWSGFQSYPVPLQKAGVPPQDSSIPIIVGGDKGKVFRRVARLADGWYPATVVPEYLEPLIPQFEEACSEEGRDPKGIEITPMWIPAMTGPDAIKKYEDLGVSRLVVPTQALEGSTSAEKVDRFVDGFMSNA